MSAILQGITIAAAAALVFSVACLLLLWAVCWTIDIWQRVTGR